MRACLCAMILLLLTTGVFGEEITILGNDYSHLRFYGRQDANGDSYRHYEIS